MAKNQTPPAVVTDNPAATSNTLTDGPASNPGNKILLPNPNGWQIGEAPGPGGRSPHLYISGEASVTGSDKGIAIAEASWIDRTPVIAVSAGSGNSWYYVNTAPANQFPLGNGQYLLKSKTFADVVTYNNFDAAATLGRVIIPISSDPTQLQLPTVHAHTTNDGKLKLLEKVGLLDISFEQEGEDYTQTLNDSYIATALWTENETGLTSIKLPNISTFKESQGIVDSYWSRVDEYVAWDATDTPAILYVNFPSGYENNVFDSEISVSRYNNTTQQWQSLDPIVLTDEGEDRPTLPHGSTVITFDADDRLILAWLEYRYTDDNITMSMQMRRWDGSAWTTMPTPARSQDLRPLCSRYGSCRENMIGGTVDDNGQLWFAWADHDAIRVDRWAVDELEEETAEPSWTQMPGISNVGLLSSIEPQFAVTDDGQVYVAAAFHDHDDSVQVRVFQLAADKQSWQAIRDLDYGADVFSDRKHVLAMSLSLTTSGQPIVTLTEPVMLSYFSNLETSLDARGFYDDVLQKKSTIKQWDGTQWQRISHGNSDGTDDFLSEWDQNVKRGRYLTAGYSPVPVTLDSKGAAVAVVPHSDFGIEEQVDWDENWANIYRAPENAEIEDWLRLPTPTVPRSDKHGKVVEPIAQFGYDDTLYLSGKTTFKSGGRYQHYWWQYKPGDSRWGSGEWELLPNPVGDDAVGVDIAQHTSTVGNPIYAWFEWFPIEGEQVGATYRLMIQQWDGNAWQSLAGDAPEDIVPRHIGTDRNIHVDGLHITRPNRDSLFVSWRETPGYESTAKSAYKIRSWNTKRGQLDPAQTLPRFSNISIVSSNTGKTYLVGNDNIGDGTISGDSTLLSVYELNADGLWIARSGEGTDIDVTRVRNTGEVDAWVNTDGELTVSYNPIGELFGVRHKRWDGKVWTDYEPTVLGTSIPSSPDEHTLRYNFYASQRHDIKRTCYSWFDSTTNREKATSNFNVNCIDE